MKQVRVAVCLWGTMRSPNSCLHTLYKNIIEPWQTDVIVCVNECYSHPDKSDSERVDMLRQFGANIVEQDIRKQPDLNTFFPKSFYDKFIPMAQERLKQHGNPCWVNFVGPLVGTHAALHIRVNWYKLSNILRDKNYVDKYDYFLITRPDHLYMFPMFDKSFLNEDEIVHYDEHGFGGVNSDFVIVSKKNVLDWLNKMSVQYFCDETLQDILIDQMKHMSLWISEECTALITRLNPWKLKPMSINSFIACDSPKEMSSWNGVVFDGEHYFKYHSNRDHCKHNYGLWKDNYRWTNTVDKIKLVK